MKEKWKMKVKVRKDAICVLSLGRISIRCRWWALDLTEKLTNPQFSIYCIGNSCLRTGARMFHKESAPTPRKQHHCWRRGTGGDPKSHFRKCLQNRAWLGRVTASAPQVPRGRPEKSVVALPCWLLN